MHDCGNHGKPPRASLVEQLRTATNSCVWSLAVLHRGRARSLQYRGTIAVHHRPPSTVNVLKAAAISEENMPSKDPQLAAAGTAAGAGVAVQSVELLYGRGKITAEVVRLT